MLRLKQWVWLGVVLLAVVTVAAGQQLFRCRTAEVTQRMMQELGITPEKIRAAYEAFQSRQAGRELPSFFYGGWGSSLYPTQGLVGTLRGLHVLIRPNSPDIFPDPRHTAEFYRRFLFDESKPDSLASFVKEASYGRLRLMGDAFGPVTVDVPVATTGNITHIASLSTSVLQSIIRQVINALDPLVDFTRYDSDGDGRMDLLILTIASDPDARPPNGNFLQDPTYGAFTVVWGKMRLISPTFPPLAVTEEGVRVECAIFVHEVDSLEDSNLGGCGTYAHEFGHAFGLPDLYNPYNLVQVDPGAWSLMATGDRFFPGRITLNPNRPGGHPGHFDPWSKIMLGWVTPIEVTRHIGTVTIPVWSEQPVAYRLWAFGSPLSDEYFLVVNRQLRGFDNLLPGAGLNIFRIDRSILSDPVLYYQNAVQNNPSRKGVDLVDADGRTDMDNAVAQVQAFDWVNFGFQGWAQGNWGDDGDPYPGRTNNTRFDLLSTPPSLSYRGLDSGVRVTDIRPLPDGSVQVTLSVATAGQATILGPRDGEIVYTNRPLLQVQFFAPLGAVADVDPASIQVFLNGVSVTIANPAAVFNEATQTLRLPLENLPSGTHTVEVRARSRAGVDIPPVTTTFSVLPFRLSPLRDRAGRILPFMITLPYNFQDPTVPPERRSPEFVFGIPSTQRFIARWGVVTAAGHQDYLFSGEFVSLAPGRAYWVRLPQDTYLSVDAPDVDRTQPFRIANEPVWDRNALDVGWQQVGNPYPFPINASAVSVLLLSGQVLSLAEAVQQGVLLDTVYQFTVVEGVPTYVAIKVQDWLLSPFAGYWIYKFKPCSLVVMPTPVSGTREAGRGTKGWSISTLLSVEVWGEKAETPYRVALTNNADGIPAPPAAPGMTAWAGLTPLTGATRSGLPFMEVPATKAGRWLLTIKSAKPNQKVTLQWKAAGKSPTQVTLVDPQTHRSLVLQGAGEWTITTDETGTRTLVLSVGAERDLPLRIVDVKVTRTRGNSYLITGRLTVPAWVRAEIRTLTGRLVQVLPSSDSVTMQPRFVWDGSTLTGERVAAGPFLLRLSAKDNLGRETQRVVVLK